MNCGLIETLSHQATASDIIPFLRRGRHVLGLRGQGFYGHRRSGEPVARWCSGQTAYWTRHSNGARPKRPLDGSGSRSKEKKPADGRHDSPNSNLPRATILRSHKWRGLPGAIDRFGFGPIEAQGHEERAGRRWQPVGLLVLAWRLLLDEEC
jgi:hypothetical protein